MAEILAIREVQLLLGSIALGLIAGALTVARARPESPAWPVQLYLILLRSSNVPRYRQYASSRTTFSLKEQFVITAFVWFFIFWFFISSVWRSTAVFAVALIRS